MSAVAFAPLAPASSVSNAAAKCLRRARERLDGRIPRETQSFRMQMSRDLGEDGLE